MTQELVYRLDDPGYTIYHRAALGGLAATIQAWGNTVPTGITAKVERLQVRVKWEHLTDHVALERILKASFKLTPEKIIDLPGQFVSQENTLLKVAIHNGICTSFLQHPKMRLGEKTPRDIYVKVAESDQALRLSYKAIDTYAHQKAQGTGLLEKPKKESEEHSEQFPETALIPQFLIPGALRGVKALEDEPAKVILLHFLIVACPIFFLRPQIQQERASTCVIIPDVVDLISFATAVRRIATASKETPKLTNQYLGRLVAGAEEAALRFLIDLKATEVSDELCVGGCQAIAMGKVPWDQNQINRSQTVHLRRDYPEISIFEAAIRTLGGSKVIHTSRGESLAIPTNALPSLIAANLAADRHWCFNFKSLVSIQKEFTRMSFVREGLIQMKQAIQNSDDKAIIESFQTAWGIQMGKLGERARTGKLSFERLVEVRREKIRNEILRTKTSSQLANWFLRFCTEATKGGTLLSVRENAASIYEMLFNASNFERVQNLLLFALLSYESKKSKNNLEEN